jgi:hypothetical protein
VRLVQAREQQLVEGGAVRINSGLPVSHSGPGLSNGPTLSATAGRKPEPSPANLLACTTISRIQACEAGLPQPKSAPGCGAGGPAMFRERDALALESLDVESIRQVIGFFELLDRWDREAHAN